jgi:hypothetical protein
MKKTDESAEQVNEIVNNTEHSIEEVMEKVIKIENKIKVSAFGKTRRN